MKKTIYLAGGCFWGCQKYFDLIPGVTGTRVGYANGTLQDPTYEQVRTRGRSKRKSRRWKTGWAGPSRWKPAPLPAFIPRRSTTRNTWKSTLTDTVTSILTEKCFT